MTPDLEPFFANVNTFIVATIRERMTAVGEPRDEYARACRIFARHAMGACLGLGPIIKPGLDADTIYRAVYSKTMAEIVRLAGEAALDVYSAEVYVNAVQRGFEEAKAVHQAEGDTP